MLVANTSLKILNICYTNHALDAFLEGLESGGITDIVRIGGKSQSNKIQKYQLRDLAVSTTNFSWCQHAVSVDLHSELYCVNIIAATVVAYLVYMHGLSTVVAASDVQQCNSSTLLQLNDD
jgi:hypothetical protein